MNMRFKIILLTFLGTTGFWFVTIIGLFWLLPRNTEVSFSDDSRHKGFCALLTARNTDAQPVTFTVAELQTNAVNASRPEAVLLERQLPPSGELRVGIKKTKTPTR
jgi:hypothetical protein